MMTVILVVQHHISVLYKYYFIFLISYFSFSCSHINSYKLYIFILAVKYFLFFGYSINIAPLSV